MPGDGGRAAEPRQPIGSVEKALRVLGMFRGHPKLTVSQVSADLGVARSTAHRLLAMLQYYGFAQQQPGSRAYTPGGALLEIALAALGSLDVRAIARPEIEALSRETGETVHLVVLEGPRTRVIDSVECRAALRVSSRTGGSMPAHLTSAGKALLALLSPEQVTALMGDDPLPAHTPRSITTMAALHAELDAIRERGYATNIEENELAIAAVGVAIPVPPGTTRAAITVAGPASRMPLDRLPRVAEQIRVTADRVAQRLAGYMDTRAPAPEENTADPVA